MKMLPVLLLTIFYVSLAFHDDDEAPKPGDGRRSQIIENIAYARQFRVSQSSD